jgi:hypothetical protein
MRARQCRAPTGDDIILYCRMSDRTQSEFYIMAIGESDAYGGKLRFY